MKLRKMNQLLMKNTIQLEMLKHLKIMKVLKLKTLELLLNLKDPIKHMLKVKISLTKHL